MVTASIGIEHKRTGILSSCTGSPLYMCSVVIKISMIIGNFYEGGINDPVAIKLLMVAIALNLF